MKRWTRAAALIVASAGLVVVPTAQGVGPGGWDHVGTGATATSASLNNDVLALSTGLPGQLLVAGKFTNAGGMTGRNRIASWNGTAWSSVGPVNSLNGEARALATAGGKVYVGGTFTDAGGNTQADFVAVWNGSAWGTVCNGAPLTGNVDALAVVGNTIYVGGEYQNGFGNSDGDYLVGCDLTTGLVTATTSVASFPGPVYALAADSNGRLYAGGNFSNLDGNSASDYVAGFSAGTWTSLGFGAGNIGHVTGAVRSLATSGTDLYIGSDAANIASLPTADHVARWDGSQWHALGSNAAGTDGYLPAVTSVFALHVTAGAVYASGSWVNVGGDPTSDFLAGYTTSAGWGPIGTDGAGGGAFNAKTEALAFFQNVLYAGGNFTSAGGDTLARFLARYTPFGPFPSNAIKIVKVVIKKKLGIAAMTVKVPGAGELEVLGARIKHPDKAVDEKGKVVLTIRPTRSTKAELKDDGKAKVTVKVRFTPTGGKARVEKLRVTLVLQD